MHHIYGRPTLAYKIWTELGQRQKDINVYKNLALKLKSIGEASSWADKAIEIQKDKLKKNYRPLI